MASYSESNPNLHHQALAEPGGLMPLTTARRPFQNGFATMNKVLLVDDDPSLRRLLNKILTDNGYEVMEANDGSQALAMFEHDCPNFVVTDWEMPLLSGLELCQRVRALELPHYVYLLFVTGRATLESMIAGLDAGADDFLVKPVNHVELLARMKAGGRVLEMQREMSLLASTDALTGIPSRRSFFEAFSKEFARAQRHHLPLSCVILDVDYFKRVNDTHGHPAGDQILKQVAQVLQDNSREHDQVCRYGGEEFCALLPNTSESAALVWAERCRRAIAEISHDVGRGNVRITASFGVAQLLDEVHSSQELTDRADQALLVAKQSGRDRVVTFSSLDSAERLEMAGQSGPRDPFLGIVAADVMASPVACLHQDDTLGQAADFFCRFRINSAPVVDQSGRLTGFLSEKDVMAVMLSTNSWGKLVGDVMKRNVVCYDEDTPVRAIYDLLCRVTIRRVIVARDGQPVGVISRGNLLRWFHNWRQLGQRFATMQEEGNGTHLIARLDEIAAELAGQANQLKDNLHGESDSLVPLLVDSSSRMQELLTDLLTCSRPLANPANEGLSSAF